MSESTIDKKRENAISRQLAVYGHETMAKLVAMDVLIVGLRGLGIEAAKNIILAGPRSVTIFDDAPTSVEDTGVNFFLTKADIGKRRDKSCVDQLSELNSYVKVSVLDATALTAEVLHRFTVAVFTNTPLAELEVYNAICRSRTRRIPKLAADDKTVEKDAGGAPILVEVPAPVGFISGAIRGVAGYAFVDFGDVFIISDANGEAVKSAVVSHIKKGAAGATLVATMKSEAKHGFADGDYVTFREVEGMEELNTHATPLKIRDCNLYDFKLAELDTTPFSEHVMSSSGSGIVTQVKVPFAVSHASFRERLTRPLPEGEGMLITPDMAKFGRSEQLHVAFCALEAYRVTHGGALPGVKSEADAKEVVSLAKAWLAESKMPGVEAVDEGVVETVAAHAAAELPALSAFFGGILAQEVVKFTGKFTPLRQFLYFDAFEVLPKAHAALPASEFLPRGDRYDNMVGILGRAAQDRIMAQRVFVVGAGALGCEFLKNFALMGVGCGPTGHVTVTDMDTIEVSNLNRQFLFRENNIKHSKSETASRAIQVMNPDIKIDALQSPVGASTEETVFNDSFWGKIDIVVNALDNVAARTYVDHRCIFYCKPLLESGTTGTMGNTQIIIPRLTQCYSDSTDPEEEGIAMCTLKSFPTEPIHCIEWARDQFGGLFTNAVKQAHAFLQGPSAFLTKASEEPPPRRRAILENVRTVLRLAESATFESCIAQARQMAQELFVNSIKQLLFICPADHLLPGGVPFWLPPKRIPKVIGFDPISNAAHFDFIVHTAALLCSVYGITPPEGADTHPIVDPILASITVLPFTPKAGVTISTGKEDKSEEGSVDDVPEADKAEEDLRKFAAAKSIQEGGHTGAAASSSNSSTSSNTASSSASATSPAPSVAFALHPADFEKDDDDNHHIAFITAAANLRAACYSIPATTFFDVKIKAGRIIPAIATTTCSVTGLIAAEFYKVVAGAPYEAYRDMYMNLAIHAYNYAEPQGPKKSKSLTVKDPKTGELIKANSYRAVPEGFLRWDRIEIHDGAGLTPASLGERLQKEHGVAISVINAFKTPIFVEGVHRKRKTETILSLLANRKISPNAPEKELDYVVLDIGAAEITDSDSNCHIPPVILRFK